MKDRKFSVLKYLHISIILICEPKICTLLTKTRAEEHEQEQLQPIRRSSADNYYCLTVRFFMANFDLWPTTSYLKFSVYTMSWLKQQTESSSD